MGFLEGARKRENRCCSTIRAPNATKSSVQGVHYHSGRLASTRSALTVHDLTSSLKKRFDVLSACLPVAPTLL